MGKSFNSKNFGAKVDKKNHSKKQRQFNKDYNNFLYENENFQKIKPSTKQFKEFY